MTAENFLHKAFALVNGNNKEDYMDDKFPNIVGAKVEMFYNGEWVKGKIIKGYRFRDGVVTIKTEDGRELWCGLERTDLYRPSEDKTMKENKLTNEEIYKLFLTRHPQAKVSDYRPLMNVEGQGITVWLENGDVILYFPERDEAMERNDALKKIIDTYGNQSQIDIAIEEMSELTKALMKYRRMEAAGSGNMDVWADDVAEEMADVSIMLEQLKMIFKNEFSVDKYIDYKINRQIKRINERNGKA